MDTHGFAVIAAGVVLFGLVSKRLEGTIITAPMVFAVFGLLIGEAVFGLAHLDFGHGFIHGLAEVTLILVLFSDAARIDLRQLRRDHNLPVRMLLIGLPLAIVLGTLVGLVLPLGLSFWEAALLAAILAPTDAALGQSVVSSRLVPTRIRQALNVESGLNDGIALPLVLLFACLASAANAGEAEQNWILFGAMQVTLGPLAGVVIGGLGAWLIDRAAANGWMEESYEGLAILGVAFLAFAGAEITGGNGFIAAFVGGLVFGNRVRGRCGFVFEFAEAEGQLLTLLTFLIFGAAILPQAAGDIGWAAPAYTVLSLTVVRMLPITLSLFGAGVRLPTVGFLGWFGPRGLASILFALFVLEEAPMPAADHILAVTIVTVAFSILAHGVTAAPAARWYGAVARRMGECEENKPVSEMPTRTGYVMTPEAV
jgi:NhaP-type Na+/H+ or K+/H+ antiporter